MDGTMRRAALGVAATMAAGGPAPAHAKPAAKPGRIARPPGLTAAVPTKHPSAGTGKSLATAAADAPPTTAAQGFPLTVRYVTDIASKVTPYVPGVAFACAPEEGAPTPITACTALAPPGPLELVVWYQQGTGILPAVTITPHIGGRQWGQACAGTPDDRCRLVMDGPKQVGVDWYSQALSCAGGALCRGAGPLDGRWPYPPNPQPRPNPS